MSAFSFISDLEMRESVRRDYVELQACLDAKAWKAAQVLSGSIAEAVLVDSLAGSKKWTEKREKLLALGLDDLIKGAKDENFLTQNAADLGTVIKGYRNLIHPGRSIRLGESVDERTATICRQLLDMMVEQVTAERGKKYGFNAEQLLAKLETDEGAIETVDELWTRMSPHEQELFLLKVLPDRYTVIAERESWDEDDDVALMRRFERAYRSAFKRAPEAIKKKCVAAFVTLVTHGDGGSVQRHKRAFFRAPDLGFCEDDRALLVRRLVGDTSGHLGESDLMPLRGIGKFVMESEDVQTLASSIFRAMSQAKKDASRQAYADFFRDEYGLMAESARAVCRARLQALIAWVSPSGDMDRLAVLERLNTVVDHVDWEDKIPF